MRGSTIVKSHEWECAKIVRNDLSSLFKIIIVWIWLKLSTVITLICLHYSIVHNWHLIECGIIQFPCSLQISQELFRLKERIKNSFIFQFEITKPEHNRSVFILYYQYKIEIWIKEKQELKSTSTYGTCCIMHKNNEWIIFKWFGFIDWNIHHHPVMSSVYFRNIQRKKIKENMQEQKTNE